MAKTEIDLFVILAASCILFDATLEPPKMSSRPFNFVRLLARLRCAIFVVVHIDV